MREKLNHQCQQMIRKGNAPGTLHNREIHHKAYNEFCTKYWYKPFPASEWRMCQFAMHLSNESKVPETVSNYVGSVRVLHRFKGLDPPAADKIHFQKLTEGLKRSCSKPIKQAIVLDHEILRKLFEQVNFGDKLEAVVWTATLVGFSVLLHVSNLGQRARKDFDPRCHFVRSDLIEKQGILTLLVRWSKTIQHRNRSMSCPLVPSMDWRICPEHWVKRMIVIVPVKESEPLFLVREKSHRYPLTSSQVARLLKKWSKNAGLDSVKFTAHCMHRGGLNLAHKAKATGESLKVMGGWSSQAYLRYLDVDFENCVDIARKMAKLNL